MNWATLSLLLMCCLSLSEAGDGSTKVFSFHYGPEQGGVVGAAPPALFDWNFDTVSGFGAFNVSSDGICADEQTVAFHVGDLPWGTTGPVELALSFRFEGPNGIEAYLMAFESTVYSGATVFDQPVYLFGMDGGGTPSIRLGPQNNAAYAASPHRAILPGYVWVPGNWYRLTVKIAEAFVHVTVWDETQALPVGENWLDLSAGTPLIPRFNHYGFLLGRDGKDRLLTCARSFSIKATQSTVDRFERDTLTGSLWTIPTFFHAAPARIEGGRMCHDEEGYALFTPTFDGNVRLSLSLVLPAAAPSPGRVLLHAYAAESSTNVASAFNLTWGLEYPGGLEAQFVARLNGAELASQALLYADVGMRNLTLVTYLSGLGVVSELRDSGTGASLGLLRVDNLPAAIVGLSNPWGVFAVQLGGACIDCWNVEFNLDPDASSPAVLWQDRFNRGQSVVNANDYLEHDFAVANNQVCANSQVMALVNRTYLGSIRADFYFSGLSNPAGWDARVLLAGTFKGSSTNVTWTGGVVAAPVGLALQARSVGGVAQTEEFAATPLSLQQLPRNNDRYYHVVVFQTARDTFVELRSLDDRLLAVLHNASALFAVEHYGFVVGGPGSARSCLDDFTLQNQDFLPYSSSSAASPSSSSSSSSSAPPPPSFSSSSSSAPDIPSSSSSSSAPAIPSSSSSSSALDIPSSSSSSSAPGIPSSSSSSAPAIPSSSSSSAPDIPSSSSSSAPVVPSSSSSSAPVVPSSSSSSAPVVPSSSSSSAPVVPSSSSSSAPVVPSSSSSSAPVIPSSSSSSAPVVPSSSSSSSAPFSSSSSSAPFSSSSAPFSSSSAPGCDATVDECVAYLPYPNCACAQCSAHHWLNGISCEACPVACEICQDASTCLACVSGRYLQGGLCVDCSCGAGQFMSTPCNGTTTTNSPTCSACAHRPCPLHARQTGVTCDGHANVDTQTCTPCGNGGPVSYTCPGNPPVPTGTVCPGNTSVDTQTCGDVLVIPCGHSPVSEFDALLGHPPLLRPSYALQCQSCPRPSGASAGQLREVWGDGWYTWDSDFCASALHAVNVTSGTFRVAFAVETAATVPRTAYPSATRNAHVSQAWSLPFPIVYRFAQRWDEALHAWLPVVPPAVLLQEAESPPVLGEISAVARFEAGALRAPQRTHTSPAVHWPRARTPSSALNAHMKQGERASRSGPVALTEPLSLTPLVFNHGPAATN